MKHDFYYERKVYYHDTDWAGVVYYGSYLKFLEEARTAYFASKGVDIMAHEKNGLLLPVVHLEIDYKASACYGDLVRVYVMVEKTGRSSMHLRYEIKKDGQTLVTAYLVAAFLDRNKKPMKIPEEITSALHS